MKRFKSFLTEKAALPQYKPSGEMSVDSNTIKVPNQATGGPIPLDKGGPSHSPILTKTPMPLLAPSKPVKDPNKYDQGFDDDQAGAVESGKKFLKKRAEGGFNSSVPKMTPSTNVIDRRNQVMPGFQVNPKSYGDKFSDLTKMDRRTIGDPGNTDGALGLERVPSYPGTQSGPAITNSRDATMNNWLNHNMLGDANHPDTPKPKFEGGRSIDPIRHFAAPPPTGGSGYSSSGSAEGGWMKPGQSLDFLGMLPNRHVDIKGGRESENVQDLRNQPQPASNKASEPIAGVRGSRGTQSGRGPADYPSWITPREIAADRESGAPTHTNPGNKQKGAWTNMPVSSVIGPPKENPSLNPFSKNFEPYASQVAHGLSDLIQDPMPLRQKGEKILQGIPEGGKKRAEGGVSDFSRDLNKHMSPFIPWAPTDGASGTGRPGSAMRSLGRVDSGSFDAAPNKGFGDPNPLGKAPSGQEYPQNSTATMPSRPYDGGMTGAAPPRNVPYTGKPNPKISAEGGKKSRSHEHGGMLFYGPQEK